MRSGVTPLTAKRDRSETTNNIINHIHTALHTYSGHSATLPHPTHSAATHKSRIDGAVRTNSGD